MERFAGPVKRSMMIAGHATSISLEPIFWDALRAAAKAEGLPLNALVARIPVGRLGRAEEIARGVTFLCGEEAGFITGSTLSINGGQHMY